MIAARLFHQANTQINESETAEGIVPPLLLQIRLEMELDL